MEKLKESESTNQSEALQQAVALSKMDLTDLDTRRRLKQQIRRIVSRIELTINKAPRLRAATVSFSLINGAKRSFRMQVRQAKGGLLNMPDMPRTCTYDFGLSGDVPAGAVAVRLPESVDRHLPGAVKRSDYHKVKTGWRIPRRATAAVQAITA